jgi:hypothetical protein
LLTPELNETIVTTCRYVGISVDSATSETYSIGRKLNLFHQTIENVRKLVKVNKGYCDIAYKFLIFSYNQYEIFKACQLAKSLGVRDFHARPADFRHQGMGELKRKNNEYDIPIIKKQFEKCHKLEDEDFKVFTVMHKFNNDFTPLKNFSQCYAIPLVIQLCADGNVYSCVDQRFQPKYLLGTHYPDPENILTFWGGKEHQEIVFGDTPKECQTRCTFGFYNKVAEEVFMDKDPFCKNFI